MTSDRTFVFEKPHFVGARIGRQCKIIRHGGFSPGYGQPPELVGKAVGFSRGSALAVHFANVVDEKKIRLSNGSREEPAIRFPGIWDLVASFGSRRKAHGKTGISTAMPPDGRRSGSAG
jgi:hypothetical protein